MFHIGNPTTVHAREGHFFRAAVKAGTQERGTERGTEVTWLHTGNYDTGSHDQR